MKRNLYYYIYISFCTIFRERLVVEYERTGDMLADLGSDQTSWHNPYQGGYYPTQVTNISKANFLYYIMIKLVSI